MGNSIQPGSKLAFIFKITKKSVSLYKYILRKFFSDFPLFYYTQYQVKNVLFVSLHQRRERGLVTREHRPYYVNIIYMLGHCS